ncbi:FtsQ-type POTRA domain-containing protein [Patescibacteria group bacterium]|nr:FtsQ-type POTRA domain-containing protein [Patescibacteria group bacterium]
MKHRYKRSYKTVRKRSVFDILKIFKHKITWIIVLILALIGGLMHLFIFSSVFQIKNIQISETTKSLTEEIRNIISENTGNIFLSDLKGISQDILEKYPQINNVNIKRKFPDKVIVQIQERQPVAVFCISSLISTLRIFKPEEQGLLNCFHLDEEGIVFEETSEIAEFLVIKIKNPVRGLRLGRKMIDKEYLEKILTIGLELKDVQILEIYPYSKNRLDIKTSESWEVYFNAKENINPQIEELNILLKEKLPPEERGSLEYIDLRFEKIYIKRSN